MVKLYSWFQNILKKIIVNYLITNLIFLLSFSTLFSISSYCSINYDSLFVNSDVVLSGRITNVLGGFIDDLGTERFMVSLSTDSIYKQNFYIDTNPTNITWVVSNLGCNEIPLEKCIAKYREGKWIFFLNVSHFYGGDEIADFKVLPYSPENEKSVLKIRNDHLIVINHFNRDKICNEDCALCKNIEIENWKKVERYIAKHSNDRTGLTWMQHRRIKWTLTDRCILASLPSSMGVRIKFITFEGEPEAYLGYQVGYIKTFGTWMPYLLHNLWGLQLFKYFSFENTDTLILRSFLIDTNYSEQYLEFEKSNSSRMLTDTSEYERYGINIPLPDDYVLLTSVFDGELRLFEDYKTMPDYIGYAKTYIDELENEEKIYLLCLMTTHTIPEVGEYSMRALQRLNDERCIPFLIYISEYRSEMYIKGWENAELFRSYMNTLVETLDYLTGCKTHPLFIPYGYYHDVFDLSTNISIWKKKIK